MSRVWSDSRVKLSNQNSVFTQLTCWKTGLNVGDKPRILGTFKMPRRRRQPERKKSNRLTRQNNNLSRFFVHSFAVT